VELRAAAEALLPDPEIPDAFMEPPLQDATPVAAMQAAAFAAAAAGERVGRYKLTEMIAAGGMGVGYRAVRADDQYEQQVAVKIIKRGMDSADILMRFRRERQLLAQLEHPNITRLIDGGATDDGRPFLVMEYVAGIPIDRYCDLKKLNIGARLKLFRTVC